MKNISYLLITLFTIAFTSKAVAQNETYKQISTTTTTRSNGWDERQMSYHGMTYNVLDTNYIPASRMGQHRRFLNSEYQFPAKPRNMWEIGIAAGLLNYTADVPSLLLWQGGGYAFSGHVRKAWGYTFSTRLQYMIGVAKGLQWQQTGNYQKNPAWTQHGYKPADIHVPTRTESEIEYINYNYRSTAQQLNVDFMFNTNNIRFHKANTGMSFYGYLGIGAFLFNTKVNALDANGQKYDFEQMINDMGYKEVHGNYRKIQKGLQSRMDNTYETDAENERAKRRPGIFGANTIDFCYSLGLGMQFKLNKWLNLAIEDRITIPHEEDLLDGQRWAEQTWGEAVFSQNNDMVNYLSLGLNFNIGNKRKHVEPLYWLNALIYNTSEATIGDADADGVMDQFDECPGTPEGVPVDVTGCPMDTDGDGVPDYRDKQLITPTECQPVDEDGIGKCPCPDCMLTAGPCSNIPAGALVFDNNSARIKSGIQSSIATLAAAMKANPTCKVVLTGSGSGSKVQEQRSWDRVEAVITYLSERYGIDRNRFIFQYGQPGDVNTVNYRPAMEGEDGFSNVPPPFPNLRRD